MVQQISQSGHLKSLEILDIFGQFCNENIHFHGVNELDAFRPVE